MIDTAILPVAGLGTRMLPATKEQPKEMLPVPVRHPRYGLVFKPFLQLVYENLYAAGIRRFIFVVGRGKRSIEDHFTPDWGYADYLESRGKKREAEMLREFYHMIESSTIAWVNQPQPLGFGDAVYRGALLAGDKPFIVHAGDILLYNPGDNSSPILSRLIRLYSEREPDALIVLRRVKDPRHYGVAVVEEKNNGVYVVRSVVEKPEKPPSNLAIAAIYAFHPVITKALKTLKPSKRGEIELTDAIKRLIEWGLRVEAIEATSERFLDIGRPETYLETINTLIKGAEESE